MAEAGRKKLFGTDGIRGIAGEFPLDSATVESIGRALASHLRRDSGGAPRLVIGRDTRQSGPCIEQALARGAASAGAQVESAGVITTPGVAFISRALEYDAGVVISASHNPFQDNGIKVFSPSGSKLGDETERGIEAEVLSPDPRPASRTESPAPLEFPNRESEFRERYISYLVDDIGRGLDLSGIRLAVDCANGAASSIAPGVFGRLGATLDVLFASPDGTNINEGCGSLHLALLQQYVVANSMDLGIAFDGDADRALFVDASGNIVDGDATLLFLADHLKSRGLLAGDIVVATVMSNVGLEIALRERGLELVRANVGDRYVLEQLLEKGAKLGGEQSGHIIFPDISLAGDGIITALELLRSVRETGLSFSELSGRMRKYPQVLLNVRVRSKPELESLPEVKAEMERVAGELQGRGRLLVRYSGTENLARVMIEGEEQAEIEEQANRIAAVIERAIGN
ncbi:MAG TPA: phosphoglucosamine mutase [Blastocatellia bacterium]